ncbi:hypothetical protein AB0I60_31420 [Actinosynnema sp. NPDC050436]|uniref:hypothetical protein n=1 Tax=Actinosynnema sp. NPDC050436 TaxID=3155659 RepID=UPI0033E9BE34
MTMRSRAWQTPFTEVPWADIAAWFHEGAAREPAIRYGADIVGSVRSCGDVLIEHRSPTGHDDRVIVPVAQAVPLFWRFVAEKFGVHADRSR